MSPVDNKENIEDWGNLSYDEMISSTLNRSSRMLTSAPRQKTVTPMRKKKFTGKNLSRSFSQFCDDIDEQRVMIVEEISQSTKQVRFYQCDSGFTENSCLPGDFYVSAAQDQTLDVSMRSDL